MGDEPKLFQAFLAWHQQQIVHALQVGSPPEWDHVPEEFQVDLAALDKLDDNSLWQIVRSRKTAEQMEISS
ncbi:hypothetical protein H1Q63_24890 [Desmonostoc muscorum CCALA 125]|nr:hypothetical protein [Desmonostoc muscorum CCALA 125]